MEQTSPNFSRPKNIRLHLDRISRIFIKILPIYWAFLTYMLLKPGTESRDYWFIFEGIDKMIHVSTFILLGFSFMAAFPKIRFVVFIQVMLIYALLTELLQEEMLLGRSLEIFDLFADTVGVLLGYFLFQKIKSLPF